MATISAKNCRLQLAAATNHGGNQSPVFIQLPSGELIEIETVTWDEMSETIRVIVPQPIPPVTP